MQAIENQELCELIKKRGNFITSFRYLDVYGLQLTAKEIGKTFDTITYPAISGVLGRLKIKGYVFLIISLKGKKIYQSLVVRQLPNEIECRILSLWSYREKGWLVDFATFFKIFEGRCKKLGIKKIKIFYRSYWPYAKMLGGFLGKIGWRGPQTKQYLYWLDDTSVLLSSPYLNRKIPDHCEILNANTKLLNELEVELQKDKWKEYPEVLYPLQMRDDIEMRASFVLKYKGEIAGWSVLHRMRKDVVQVTSLYVDAPNCQWMGLRMLSEAKRNMDAIGKDDDKAHFIVDIKNQKMLKILDKVLIPLGLRKFTLDEYFTIL